MCHQIKPETDDCVKKKEDLKTLRARRENASICANAERRRVVLECMEQRKQQP